MALTTVIIITLAVGSIISALLLIKQSAKKFDLTPEQLARIKARNQRLEEQERKQNE